MQNYVKVIEIMISHTYFNIKKKKISSKLRVRIKAFLMFFFLILYKAVHIINLSMYTNNNKNDNYFTCRRKSN